MSAEPLTLFGDDDTPTECRYPLVAGRTGYRYGCRCNRCTTAKGDRTPPSPLCRMPGCTNPKRRVQAARYCDEHATSRNYVINPNPLAATTCHLCDTPCSARRKTATALCADCKQHRHYIENWRRHGVTRDTINKWLADPRCWICSGALSLRWNGRANDSINVDHDHRCCPGGYGCAECVRGLTHQGCNVDIGRLETLIAHVGTARAHELIDLLGYQ